MSVCQHRPEPGGMWTSCLMACGGCACGAEVVTETVEDA
jgi:hypothetical protein